MFSESLRSVFVVFRGRITGRSVRLGRRRLSKKLRSFVCESSTNNDLLSGSTMVVDGARGKVRSTRLCVFVLY